MNVEGIANLARHIWSSIVPPFLNLLLLGVVLGDTLIRQIDKSYVAELADAYAARGIAVVSELFRGVISIFAFVDLGQLTKSINVQNLSSVSVSLLLFVSFVFLLLVYFVDNLTKLMSQLLKFCFQSWQAQGLVRRGAGAVAAFVAKRADRRYDASVRKLEDFVHLRTTRPELSDYARAAFFGGATENQVSLPEVHKVVVAWLFQNVKTGKWEGDRQAISDQLKSLVAWEDYLRVYITITALFLVLSVFELFRHGFPILLILILVIAKISITVAVMHARRRLIGVDLEEFYYFNLAAAPHAASDSHAGSG